MIWFPGIWFIVVHQDLFTWSEPPGPRSLCVFVLTDTRGLWQGWARVVGWGAWHTCSIHCWLFLGLSVPGAPVPSGGAGEPCAETAGEL